MTERDLTLLACLVYKMNHPDHKTVTCLEFGKAFAADLLTHLPLSHKTEAPPQTPTLVNPQFVKPAKKKRFDPSLSK